MLLALIVRELGLRSYPIIYQKVLRGHITSTTVQLDTLPPYYVLLELVTKYPDLLDENEETTPCRKSTGTSKRLRQWSRGYQFIISGGGHIEMFSPLYT